jgi:hypothetical protein
MCTCRPWECILRGRNWVSLEIYVKGDDHMNLEAVIEREWRCTWRLWSSEFGHMHLEAMNVEDVIERVWSCTGRSWSSEIGGQLDGSKSAGGSSEEMRDASGDFIHWFAHNCGNVENWIPHGLLRDDTGWERETVDLGIMQYTVYAVLSVCCTRYML